jgi:HD-GYP domain-containing protein (c-di-GMP phosphodiesterase class II)
MFALLSRGELAHEVERLRARVAEQERQLLQREREFERYAGRLRDALRAERAREAQVRQSYVAAVRALTNAVEARDAYTGKHAERVAAYGMKLAAAIDRDLPARPAMEFGFLLHDVGKVAIPDAILHKAAPLSRREFRLMREHPVIGHQIVSHIDFLDASAGQVVRHHHERWDGLGYPDRLRGDEIPLAARVFAVADALDAITTDRPYRRAAPLGEARRRIKESAGSQFDPEVVDALESTPDEELDEIRFATLSA